MEVREVLDSNDERKVQAQKVLDSKRLDFVSRDEPTAKFCSSELVLILWHVHTLTQTKIENSEPFTGSASARLKTGLARPAQYDTAAEDQARVSEVLMVGEVPMVTRAG